MNSLCGCDLTISQGCVVLQWCPIPVRTEFISSDPGLLTHKVIDEAKGAVNLPSCTFTLAFSWAFTSPSLLASREHLRTSETMVVSALSVSPLPGSCSCVAEMVTCFASWRLSRPLTRSDMCFKSNVCERIQHRCKTGAFPVSDRNLQYCGEPPCEV